jgi:hypothetical protein
LSKVELIQIIGHRYRRILFIAILPLLGLGTLRAATGCFLAVFFSVVVREMQPFIRESTNSLTMLAQYQILVTFLAASTFTPSTPNP